MSIKGIQDLENLNKQIGLQTIDEIKRGKNNYNNNILIRDHNKSRSPSKIAKSSTDSNLQVKPRLSNNRIDSILNKNLRIPHQQESSVMQARGGNSSLIENRVRNNHSAEREFVDQS